MPLLCCFGTLIRENHHLITVVLIRSRPIQGRVYATFSGILQCKIAYIRVSTSHTEVNLQRVGTVGETCLLTFSCEKSLSTMTICMVRRWSQAG